MLVVQSRKQIMTQKLLSLKKNLQIIIMTNIYIYIYITTPELNTLCTDLFNARFTQASLIAKTDFTSIKSKHLLVENELKKLKTFDSSYFIGKNHFEEDGTQNYLVFQSIYRRFKQAAGIGNGNYIITENLKHCLT